VARATVHRLLTSLHGEGLVDRNGVGSWLLGPEMYLLGATAASRYDISDVAQPIVRRLSVATGESAFFSVRRGNETVCLLREDGSFPIRSHVLYEGIRFPLGVASAGLVILSYLPDREVDAYLAHADLVSTYGVRHTTAEIRQRIILTRESGYAVNPGLLVEGSWGMGAAVFGTDDRPAGAFSLTGIEQRFSPERRQELGPMLLQAAHDLTSKLRQRG
jgi:DNA-binding IclR family transcriptional regulator